MSTCWLDLGACLLRPLKPGLMVVFVLLGALWQSATCAAHEVRPSYLEVQEDRAGEFEVLFKTPMRGDLRLSLAATFSGRTDALIPATTRTTGDAAVQTWRFKAVDPLRGQIVAIAGLENTMTDALVRVVFLDGTSWVRRLTPQEPSAAIPLLQSGWSVAGLYLKLGVEHILLGIDHLLFVLALLIITRGTWRLIKTVTAFTDRAQHHARARDARDMCMCRLLPVEALIALSIAFVAVEIVRQWQGREGLTARAPWLVAFTFGLLHGLGFAGALSEIGLPEGQIPLALLFFNVGVEIGQLLFIAAMLGMFAVRPARSPVLAALGRSGRALCHRQHRHVLGDRARGRILTRGHAIAREKKMIRMSSQQSVLAGLIAAALVSPAFAQDVGAPTKEQLRTGSAEASVFALCGSRLSYAAVLRRHAPAHLILHGCGCVRRPPRSEGRLPLCPRRAGHILDGPAGKALASARLPGGDRSLRQHGVLSGSVRRQARAARRPDRPQMV